MENQNLSKSELAAIDLMIAHMQENNLTQMGSFIDSIVSAVTSAASAVTSVVTAVAPVVTAIAPVVMAVAGAAAKEGANEIRGVVSKLNDLESELTLDNLIKIRNQYK